eukprot:6211483-Pleurochrysis_carterae.AAC.1
MGYRNRVLQYPNARNLGGSAGRQQHSGRQLWEGLRPGVPAHGAEAALGWSAALCFQLEEAGPRRTGSSAAATVVASSVAPPHGAQTAQSATFIVEPCVLSGSSSRVKKHSIFFEISLNNSICIKVWRQSQKSRSSHQVVRLNDCRSNAQAF